MEWFNSIKSRFSGDDTDLTKADLVEIRQEYDSADSVFNYMIDGSQRYQSNEDWLKNFVMNNTEHILYDTGDSPMDDDVSALPVRLKDQFDRLMEAYNPRESESIDEAKSCFVAHEEFAREGKEVCEHVLQECRKMEDKIERVDYLESTEENFDHNGFDHPATGPVSSFSNFVEDKVSEVESDEEDNNGDDAYKLRLNEIVYFIAEHTRKERDLDYDVELYQNLYNKNPEQAELIGSIVESSGSEGQVVRSVKNIGLDSDLPPLNEKHVEFYITPRVFNDVPSKTPEEIGLL